jgi:methylated-DNA-protein-cysteine methyltransferase-like protein
MSDFRTAVINLIKQVPRGRVVSYGQVAAAAGRPRAAREVGWVLRSTGGGPSGGPDSGLPWWRVINREGRISIKGNFESTPDLQRQLLEAEGIEVSADMLVDMEKYRFRFQPNA